MSGEKRHDAPHTFSAQRLAHTEAFGDVSTRTAIFREKLIEEFQLFENIREVGAAHAPVFDTTALFPKVKDQFDDEVDYKHLSKLLRETPHQLVKFKLFKRHEIGSGNARHKDKRLTRLKNMNNPPLGLWAHWIVEHQLFQWTILLVIVVNSLLLGVQTELTEDSDKYYRELYALEILDTLALLIFVLEIVLKWIDSFEQFWYDPWNIFDLVVTGLSALPLFIGVFVSPDESVRLAIAAQQFRLFRVFRSLKLLVRFTGLKVIISTTLQAFQSMTFIILLLFLVAYIYAIMAINLFDTNTVREDLIYQDKFSSLGAALTTLFQLITLDQWFFIYSDFAKANSPYITVAFFLSWVFIGAFAFRNIFVGVMVKNFGEAAKEMDDLRTEKRVKTAQLKAMKQQMADIKRRQRRENRRNRASKGGEDGHSVETDKLFRGVSNLSFASLLEKEAAADMASTGGSMTEAVMKRLQKFLIVSRREAEGWESALSANLSGISAAKLKTMWPRDTLFRYLRLLQTLQENMKEYQELQMLAAAALYEIHDT